MELTKSLRFGTCSWNYDSWVGSVYSKKQRYSAEYLEEYSKTYNTVEIDSWFYRIPTREDAQDYNHRVGSDFTFTAKVPGAITKPYVSGKGSPIVNPDFLSINLFKNFLDIIEPLLPKTAGLILQFEYLNREKMGSMDEFINRIGKFMSNLPKNIPIALETRNANYLKPAFFSALKGFEITPVLIDRIYMPPLAEVYSYFGHLMGESLIFRLLGGDRKEIEVKTGNKWDKIVSPQPRLEETAKAIALASTKMSVIVNVNNHYEGSGPASIDRIKKLIAS